MTKKATVPKAPKIVGKGSRAARIGAPSSRVRGPKK